MNKTFVLLGSILTAMSVIGCGGGNDTKLLYQGHASFRLTSQNGTMIYIDPYAGVGYDLLADVILVTHQHGDHNKIELVMKKDSCQIISNFEALENEKHNSFDINGILIEAVWAENKNHNPAECVGYLVTIDGIKLYFAGDTSKTEQMTTFASLGLDYAFLPCDGVYNMDAAEAAECALIIGAKNNVPIHTKPGALFDREIAESFNAPNRLIIEAGQEIALQK